MLTLFTNWVHNPNDCGYPIDPTTFRCNRSIPKGTFTFTNGRCNDGDLPCDSCVRTLRQRKQFPESWKVQSLVKLGFWTTDHENQGRDLTVPLMTPLRGKLHTTGMVESDDKRVLVKGVGYKGAITEPMKVLILRALDGYVFFDAYFER
jgi:hypothetical protein